MVPFENAEYWAEAAVGLARKSLNANPGLYWQHFTRVAARAGVSPGTMATALASIASGSPEAAAALNGLRNVIQARIITAEIVAITEAVAVGELAVTGIGGATATIAGEATVAAAESGGVLTWLKALLGGTIKLALYGVFVIGVSYFLAQKVGRVQCHVVVTNGIRSACNCINDDWIPSFILNSMKKEACGRLANRLP